MKFVAIMRRDESFDSVLAEGNEGLIQQVQSLPVILAEGGLKLRHTRNADAAFDAGVVARLIADPETNYFDAVVGELLEVGLLVRVRHALQEVVAGAGPRLGSSTSVKAGGRGIGAQNKRCKSECCELHFDGVYEEGIREKR